MFIVSFAVIVKRSVTVTVPHVGLKRHHKWLFERVRDPAQEPCGIGAVDDPVIVGERQGQHQARLERRR